jgi:hypothetical protein
MEADVSHDLEDYWNEFKVLHHTKLLDGSLEEGEDYGSRSCDGKFIIYNIYKFLAIYISVKISAIHLLFFFLSFLFLSLSLPPPPPPNGKLCVRKYCYWQD